jgi:Tfp pilus assembly protein PilF
VSELFDSLRRGRQPQARAKAARTAHGDAVLATLGYAPVPRSARSASLLRAVGVIVAIAAIWTGWRLYYQPGAEPGGPRTRPAPFVPARSTPPPQKGPSTVSRSEGVSPVAPATPVSSPSVTVASVTPPVLNALRAEQQPPSVAPSVPRAGSSRAASPPPHPPAPFPVTRPASVVAPPPSVPVSSGPNDFDLALYYHRAGDFENALQHYRAVLQKNELNASAHNNLGLLYQEKNLLPESARELQRAVLIEPRNAGTHNNYGVTLLFQGKPDEAAAEFRSALALDARNVDAMVNLALAERNQNRLDVAKETLLTALTVAPRSAAAHYNLAQLYDQTHEAASAIEHYRRFLETAGLEHAGRAAAVRARIIQLSRTPE